MAISKPKTQKPRKPYPTFPLTPHVRGWVKKIKGKVYWFGPPQDPEGARQKYLARVKEIESAAPERVDLERATVKYIANRFIDDYCIPHIQQKKMTLAWGACYRQALARFLKFVGETTPVADLTPDHFTRFLNSRNGKGIDKTVQCIRTWFIYADDQDWCRLPKFGKEFRKRSAKERRTSRRVRFFAPDECRMMLDHATGPIRAMILLALNGGMGQMDVATLRVQDVANSTIDYRRQKTGVERTIPLWPETIDAIAPFIHEKAMDDLVFITRHGKPWVREQMSKKVEGKVTVVDAVSQEFGKLLADIGLWKRSETGKPISDGRSFYTLRRTFRTIADGQGDQRAIDRIMGHAADANDMGDTYTQFIETSRLQAVVDHVHSVIFNPQAKPNRRNGRARAKQPD